MITKLQVSNRVKLEARRLGLLLQGYRFHKASQKLSLPALRLGH
jgi:hypothetical protein